MNFTIQEIAQILKADYYNVEDTSVVINHSYTDTRLIYEPEGVFIALKTEKRDGSNYLEEAFQKGADLAIVHRDVETNYPCIKVENTLTAFLLLLKHIEHNLRYLLLPSLVRKERQV